MSYRPRSCIREFPPDGVSEGNDVGFRSSLEFKVQYCLQSVKLDILLLHIVLRSYHTSSVAVFHKDLLSLQLFLNAKKMFLGEELRFLL